MKLKIAFHLILILGILILAGAAAGQAAAPISTYNQENEYLQVKYIFKIIEISKQKQSIIRLNELFFDNSSKSGIDFYNRKQVLEFLDPVSLNNLKIEYNKDNNFSYSIIEPEIIVSLFERASIEVNEEVLNIDDEDELFKSENKLFLSLFTSNISVNKQIITTDFTIETKENNFLNTTLNLVNGEENLVGILTIKNNNTINFVPNQSKFYAVYLKANFLKELTKENNEIINLDGLNNIVSSFNFDKVREQEKYIVLFLGKNNSVKSKIVFKNDFALYFGFKENEYMNLGLDNNIFSDLNFELNFYSCNEKEYFLSLGVNEEIKIHPYFSLGAGFYPIVFEIEKEKFKNHYYWVNAKIFVFNNKNKIQFYYRERNEKKVFRTEISRELGDKIDIILVNNIYQKRKEEWEVGLKWNF